MRTAVRAIGRALITVGLLILLFVAYQLWGTAIWEARAQSDLEDQFERELDAGVPTTTPPVPPPPGDAVGIIRIEKIGVDKVVVEGTAVPDLRKGPGHYTGSPLPGQLGNVAIAGHRTTYGAPFGDLDQLETGDMISVQTVTDTWEYEVAAVPRDAGQSWPAEPFVVSPGQTEVLEPSTGADGEPLATLTLTTCEPKYSAAERLIVKAQLTGTRQPLPAPATQPRLVLDTGLSGGSESKTPTIVWGLVAAAVGGLWWLVFHRYPRWTTWFGGVVPFLVALFVFYTFLERVLPNNY